MTGIEGVDDREVVFMDGTGMFGSGVTVSQTTESHARECNEETHCCDSHGEIVEDGKS